MSTRAKPKAEHPAPHERQAARRYLEHDYAAEQLHGEPAREAHRNAQAIDEEHPRARDIALTGTDRELGKLPPHLRRHQLEARKRAGIRADQLEPIRREYRRGPYREPDESEPSRPRRARETAAAASSRAGDLLASGAGAAADTSWGELIGDFFVWGMALSIGYLFLTRAAAMGKLFEGATNIARAVVSPTTDPLNPKGAL